MPRAVTVYFVKRVFFSLVAFLAVTVLAFVVFQVIAVYAPPPGASTATAYWHYVKGIFLHGSLGETYNRRDLTGFIFELFPVTAAVVVGGALIWLAISIPLAIFSALHPRSLFDRGVLAVTLVALCVHPLVIGLFLSYTIAFKAGLAPIQGYCQVFSPPPGAACSGFGSWLSHLVLPCLTLAVMFTALYTRMLRASILEELSQEYIRTARAKGATERRVLVRHVFRNVLLPLVTMLGMDLGLAVTAAIYVEIVFGLPGLGLTAWLSIQREDWPTLQGIVVFTGFLVIAANLVVDLIYALLDPRIRLTKQPASA
jgi:peptide/nickel transport system permease protein